ncbi:hypothetical protein [Parapedobacter sp.]
MAIVSIVIFLMVCLFRYYETGDFVASLLNGLTLAMSVLGQNTNK